MEEIEKTKTCQRELAKLKKLRESRSKHVEAKLDLETGKIQVFCRYDDPMKQEESLTEEIAKDYLVTIIKLLSGGYVLPLTYVGKTLWVKVKENGETGQFVRCPIHAPQ